MATRQLSADGTGGSGRYRIRSTGTFAIFDAGQDRDLTPRGRKARAILAYLSNGPAGRVSREELIELLWGDRGQDQARASLRQSLLEIRQACGDLVRADREEVWIDAARLAPEEKDAAASEAFANLNNISPEFDEWLRSERARRADQAWESLRHEVEVLLAHNRGAEANPLIERMRKIDPYNEDWVRLAMQAEFQAGHPAAIDRDFSDIETLLMRDLGVAPASETRALRDRLLAELTSARADVRKSAVEDDTHALASRSRRPWLALMSVAAVAAVAGTVWVIQPSAGKPPRIAVLPFEATEVEPALAEGMSDELLSQLSRNQGLRVIGRTSSSQFKGRAADLRSIGRTLDVQYIVEGNVRGAGSELRVAVTLVRARDGSALWARTFHGSLGSLESIQQAVGSAVGRSLNAGIPAATGRRARGEAYALYVRAKALMRDRDADGQARALELLREAVRIDPKFAAGWAQLAVASHLKFEKEVIVDLGGPEPIRMSKRAAVERALRLDPNLAEAHAAMALVDGGWFTKEKARFHLHRALQLAPNDTQALYWWGMAVTVTGDQPRAAKIYREAASLDPLWKRPVQEAVTSSLNSGDRATAMRLLRTIKDANPKAATEVEIQMAFNEADFSRVVQLAFSDPAEPWDGGKETAVRTLISLGFKREANLLAHFGAFGRVVLPGPAPPLPVVLERIRSDAAEGDDRPILVASVFELAREHRWSDVAAIYDADLGLIEDVRGTDAGGRFDRVLFGPILAICLAKAGRKQEAIALALAADKAAKAILAYGDTIPDVLIPIAGVDAVLGRRAAALSHLEQAFEKNWRLDEVPLRLAERPEFATLRGDPRFERLRALQDAHIARERREVIALHLF